MSLFSPNEHYGWCKIKIVINNHFAHEDVNLLGRDVITWKCIDQIYLYFVSIEEKSLPGFSTLKTNMLVLIAVHREHDPPRNPFISLIIKGGDKSFGILNHMYISKKNSQSNPSEK